jgi:prepilin-type N-terminal cleavage/methylation domain-containing protein/prepilin-type processing-associated H-X9-DG protein
MNIWVESPPMKRGFTLIELLVVIAIVSILASILFPVFARAKDSAKATVSQSNLRQIGLAINMYVQDNEGFPMHSSVVTPQRRWADHVQPYVKSEDIFIAPLAPPDMITRIWAHTVGTSDERKWGGYGYNYQYLGNSRNPSPDAPNLPFSARESNLEFPAQMIMVSDTQGARKADDSITGVYVVDPPLGSERGSGRGLYYEVGSQPKNRAKPAPRHAGQAMVLFVDGHVKLMPPSRMDDSNGDGTEDNGWYNGFFDAVLRR